MSRPIPAETQLTPTGLRVRAHETTSPASAIQTTIEIDRYTTHAMGGTHAYVTVNAAAVHPERVQPRSAMLALSATQALAVAQALLGPGYRIEIEKETAATPEQFKQRMGEISKQFASDPEVLHGKMDALLCETLESLGYGEGVRVFRGATVWFA